MYKVFWIQQCIKIYKHEILGNVKREKEKQHRFLFVRRRKKNMGLWFVCLFVGWDLGLETWGGVGEGPRKVGSISNGHCFGKM